MLPEPSALPSSLPMPTTLSLVEAINTALATGSLSAGLALLVQTLHYQGEHLTTTLLLTPELVSQLNLKPVPGTADQATVPGVAVPVCHITITTELPTEPHLLLPLVQHNEPLGWLRVQFSAKELDQQFPTPPQLQLGQQYATSIGALLVWGREQSERERHALRSVQTLVQHIHQTRLTGMNDLTAGLAHEINNPISAIVGIASLIQRDVAMVPGIREDLEAIKTEAMRISELVRRLAHFGQAAATNKAPVAINHVLTDTLAVMRGLFEPRQIRCDVHLPEESPLVLGNQAQLQQLCLDLLDNAIDAVETSDQPVITVRVEQTERDVVIVIEDNGCGIPDEYRDRVFEMGFTTKSKHSTRCGLGVGLPMALEIIRNHWGTLHLDSVVWRGTSCIIRLPTI